MLFQSLRHNIFRPTPPQAVGLSDEQSHTDTSKLQTNSNQEHTPQIETLTVEKYLDELNRRDRMRTLGC